MEIKFKIKTCMCTQAHAYIKKLKWKQRGERETENTYFIKINEYIDTLWEKNWGITFRAATITQNSGELESTSAEASLIICSKFGPEKRRNGIT